MIPPARSFRVVSPFVKHLCSHRGSKEQNGKTKKKGNNRQERKDAGLGFFGRPPSSNVAREDHELGPPSFPCQFRARWLLPPSRGNWCYAWSVVVPALAVPSPCSVLTNVASVESWAPPSTPGTCDKSKSRTITLVATLLHPLGKCVAKATGVGEGAKCGRARSPLVLRNSWEKRWNGTPATLSHSRPKMATMPRS